MPSFSIAKGRSPPPPAVPRVVLEAAVHVLQGLGRWGRVRGVFLVVDVVRVVVVVAVVLRGVLERPMRYYVTKN